eukprot:10595141-Karenia_brevis.AAC.1
MFHLLAWQILLDVRKRSNQKAGPHCRRQSFSHMNKLPGSISLAGRTPIMPRRPVATAHTASL